MEDSRTHAFFPLALLMCDVYEKTQDEAPASGASRRMGCGDSVWAKTVPDMQRLAGWW